MVSICPVSVAQQLSLNEQTLNMTTYNSNKKPTLPLTIAIVANTTWNLFNFRLSLIEKLTAEGYRVVAIAPPDAYSPYLKAAGCLYLPLPNLKRKGTNPFSDLRLMLNLYRLYRKYRVDIALHYTIKPVIFGTLSARLAGACAINTLTGLGSAFLREVLMKQLALKLYQLSLPFSSKVLFQNKDDMSLFLMHRLAPVERCLIIRGSGVNTRHFFPALSSTPSPVPRVLFIGRLLQDKGIREFVEAAKLLRQSGSIAQFEIVGSLDTGNPSSVDESELRQWQTEAHIIYHGPASDVRPYIQQCNMVVLPSYREGLPRVLLEGMAMGKPIITTRTAGCRETVVPDKNGYLVEVKNARSLAKAISNMIAIGHEEQQKMGALGRQMVLAHFDERLIIQKYLQVIRSVSQPGTARVDTPLPSVLTNAISSSWASQ